MKAKHCCYGVCNSDTRYYGKRKDMENVVFIPFPKPKTQREKCERWVKLCGRQHFTVNSITKDTYMCSKHFVGEKGPTKENPDPLPALATSFEKRVLSSKRKRKSPMKRYSVQTNPKRKKLKFETESSFETTCTQPSATSNISTEPDLFYTTLSEHSYSSKEDTQPEENQDDGTLQDSTCPEEEDVEQIYHCETVCPGLDLQEETVTTETVVSVNTDTTESHAGLAEAPNLRDFASTGVQTDLCFNDLQPYTDSELQDKQKLQRSLFMDYVLKDDESCKFYTGLNLAIFTMVFTWLQKKAEKMNYWRGQDTTEAKPNNNPKPGRSRKLTIKEELIMTLIRLRRGLDIEVLSDLFGIHSSNISRIFITWINFLYLELNFLISWPSKEQVRNTLPKQFKHFPKTRVVIDCTEFYIQKPSLPSSQRVTWSQYKHHNTFKALIGISPSGAFTFISKLFTGCISDRRIVEESGFLDKLQYGDDIMADRGFLIRDLAARRYATLNIPPFAMGKQLSGRAVTKTRRIASARIHVERAIGRLKTFKLLQGIIPLKLHPVLDQIVVVCAVLCNLDSKLVK